MEKNKINILLSIAVVVFCTLATIFGMAFDLRSKENFVIISGGVKYIPEWKWAAPYLVFTILALITTIVHFGIFTIPGIKNASGAAKKKYEWMFIIEIALLVSIIVSGVGLAVLGNVKPNYVWYIPLRPWITSLGICFSFGFAIILLILKIKNGGVKHEK